MILCVDSSGQGVQFTLADQDGTELASCVAEAKSELSRDMSSMFSNLFAAAQGLDPAGIRRVLAGRGPGTFIGTRVALSFANGFASAGSVELFGFDSLLAMRIASGDHSALAVRDARRGQYYVNAGRASRIVDEEQMQELVGQASHIVSDKVQPAMQADRSLARLQDLLAHCPGQLSWLESLPARAMLAAAEHESCDYVEPLYLRSFL